MLFRSAEAEEAPAAEASDEDDAEDDEAPEVPHEFRGTPFEFFFRHHGQPRRPEEDVEGQGSGILLRADGHILTNSHVLLGDGGTGKSVALLALHAYIAAEIAKFDGAAGRLPVLTIFVALPKLPNIQDGAAIDRQIKSEIGATSWAQLCLKYNIANPAVTVVIPGTDNPVHMVDNMGAARGELPDADLRRRIEQVFDDLGA